MSDFKAGVSIIALEIWLVMTIINYYNVYINRQFHLNKITFLIIGLFIAISNIKLFTFSDLWKEYNKEFAQLSKKKNIIGGMIVWSIIIFVIINFIYSFYLMSQINLPQHK
ncbi:hypothetical protein EDM00_04235 [Ornithobacterium rhinotracheale]|nr:hypothetical protein [Ornithobacterium rhinotracheale]